MNKIKINKVSINCSEIIAMMSLKGIYTKDITRDMLKVTFDLEDYNSKLNKAFKYEVTLTGEQLYQSPKYNEKIQIDTLDKSILLYRIEGVEKIIAKVMRYMLYIDLISVDEYLVYCLDHLLHYTRNKNFIDINWDKARLFFDLYVPSCISIKFNGSVQSMINASAYPTVTNIDSIAGYDEKVKGHFIGCYTDDEGRKRPLTSRNTIEHKYRLWAELIAAFLCEMYTERDNIKCSDYSNFLKVTLQLIQNKRG